MTIMNDRNHIRSVFGKRITQARESHNLSVEELAAMVGITPAHLIRIEKGKYSVRYELMANIFDALNKDVIVEPK